MSYNTQTTRYLEAEVMSRSSEWLVPLLYEHLLASMRRAAVQIENHDIEGKATSIGKATAILMELAAALDYEKGGELARNLSALYTFCTGEMLSIGRTLDHGRLLRLISIVSELHEAWLEAATEAAPRIRTGALAVADVA